MKPRTASFLSCSLLALAAFSTPAAAQTPVLNPSNGHYYVQVSSSGGSWTAARLAAAAMSHLGMPGHLATLTSAAENQWVYANLPGGKNYVWLGGFQDHNSPNFAEPGGGWAWVTGEAWVFSAWDVAQGEPNNSGGGEDFLEFAHGQPVWNDAPAAWPSVGFIVEYEQVVAPTQVVAWGDNSYGQCDVPALPQGVAYVQISASGSGYGGDHSLALLSDGAVVAWGDNQFGQCNVPALPAGISYVEVSAGYQHSLARRSDGAVVAWGQNSSGQCDVPAFPTGTSCVEIAAGGHHSLARLSDGSILFWGYSYAGIPVPGLPPGLTYVEIAAGNVHSLARRSDGSAVGWGYDADGQCNVPALPPGLSYVELAAGAEHGVARRSDGSVVAWGDNMYGQCDVPALPAGVSYVEIASTGRHTLARRSDDVVVAWGANGFGQCNVPAAPAGARYVEVAAGWRHSLARYTNAVPPPEVYCTAKTNSLGCLPTIGFSGTLALSGPDDFAIGASNVRNFRSGLLFWGRSPASVPFQGGRRCVAAPFVRTPLQDSGGTPGVDDCSGVFAYEVTNEYLDANAVLAGDELFAQYWSRDPHSPPYFTSLSDALHMWVGP